MLGIVTRRTATIKAESTCLLWEVHQDAVQKILAGHPGALQVFVPVILKSLESSAAHRLLSLHLFRNFDRNFKMLLGFECLRKVYFPKEVVVNEGQVGEGLYIINEGQAAAMTNNVVILTLNSGSHFGASIMMGMNKKMICNLVAVNVCHVLIVTAQSYSSALIQYPAMEAAQSLYRVESEAFQELAKVVWNVQMRSTVARDMVKCLGYEGADTEQATKMLMTAVFKAWILFCQDLEDKRQMEKKMCLQRWEQQRWIFNARDGRQRRVQKEQALIQHVWPPRGGPKPPPATAASTSRPNRTLPSLDASGSAKTDDWYQEAMGVKAAQTAREWGSNRRRRMVEMYLPSVADAPKSERSRRPPTTPGRRDVLYRRDILAEILDEPL